MTRRDLLLAALLAGVAVQLSVAAGHLRPLDLSVVSAPPLSVGDAVGGLAGLAADGSPSRLGLAETGRTATVLFAFHPDCVHSDTVAEDWARHFAGDGPAMTGARTLAVTRATAGAAAAYAQRFAWDVELLSMPNLSRSDMKYSLVSRTPWVFVFDSEGVLRFQDHGGELERAAQAVAAMAAAAE